MSNYKRFTVDDDEELNEMGVSNAPTSITPAQQKRRRLLLISLIVILLVVATITFIVGLASTSSTSSESPKTNNGLWNEIRLPNYAKPSHYDLKITPNLSDFTFSVNETIEIELFEKTSILVLHSAGLSIDSVTLTSASNSITPDKISYNDTLEYVYFHFSDLESWFDSGIRYVSLHLLFHADLETEMRGFYRSQYTENNQTYYMATTDFEPINARRAFIAFDEPSFKATFTVTLVVPQDFTAISNMPENYTKIENNLKEIRFEKSVKMSTYLVCYVVSKFEYVEDKDSLPIRVRVWSTPGTIDQTQYALETAVNALAKYQDYFKIKYPLPKLDLIAIPDYPAGAMENWGIITFRQTALLYDSQESSSQDKQRVNTVICHELAHQWFGNLVTMEWWDDLWLNEGFASFMEYVGTNSLEPTWEMWSQFLLLDRGVALQLDSLDTSHPIYAKINNPTEIAQQFDMITYSKGSSIIRMLEGYLNLQNTSFFTTGLENYLNEHAYGNARNIDLWNALAATSGDTNLVSMMTSWTQLTGYPLITLEMTPNGLNISQSRFLLTGTASPTVWSVPISLKAVNTGEKLVILNSEFTVIPYDVNVNGTLIANLGATGFYRVKYVNDLFVSVENVFYSEFVKNADRASILDDAWNLLFASKIDVSSTMELTSQLTQEQDFVVWQTALQRFTDLNSLIELEDYFGIFQEFVQQLLKNIVAQVGWVPNDSEIQVEKLLRGTVLRASAINGNQEAVNTAQEIFASSPGNITADLRQAIYSIVAHYGGDAEFNWFLERYQASDVPGEKIRCLDSLARFTKPYLIQRALRLSLDRDVIRPQDALRVIEIVATSIAGRDLAWDFVRENWQELAKRYLGGNFLLSELIGRVTARFTTQAKYNEVKSFFAENQVTLRAVGQALEKIQGNINWLAQNSDDLRDWLQIWVQNQQPHQ